MAQIENAVAINNWFDRVKKYIKSPIIEEYEILSFKNFSMDMENLFAGSTHMELIRSNIFPTQHTHNQSLQQPSFGDRWSQKHLNNLL